LVQRVGGRFFDTVGIGVATNGSSPEMMGQTAWQGQAVWTRLSGSRSHLEPDSTTGTGIDLGQWQVQAGTDALIGEDATGRLFAGVTGHYGKADADALFGFGNGSIDTEAYGLGLTATFIGNAGFYADGQAQWSWFDSDLSAANFGRLANGNEGTGTAVSLEIGQRIDNANGVIVTPQAQLVYSSVDFDSFTDPWGVTVKQTDGDSLVLRTGVSAEMVEVHADGSSSRGYAIANLEYEFLDGTGVNVAGTQLNSVPDQWTGELGIGGSHQWAPGFSLYGEASVATGLDNFGDSYAVKGTIGISVSF
jgi:outer membrane autotransporter protein